MKLRHETNTKGRYGINGEIYEERMGIINSCTYTQDNENKDMKIYEYSLITKEELQITTDTSEQNPVRC